MDRIGIEESSRKTDMKHTHKMLRAVVKSHAKHRLDVKNNKQKFLAFFPQFFSLFAVVLVSLALQFIFFLYRCVYVTLAFVQLIIIMYYCLTFRLFVGLSCLENQVNSCSSSCVAKGLVVCSFISSTFRIFFFQLQFEHIQQTRDKKKRTPETVNCEWIAISRAGLWFPLS